MPNFRTGNMFDHPADLYLVTSNATVNRRGELVMGRGAAREATRRYPFQNCAQYFGTALKASHSVGQRYGVLVLEPYQSKHSIGVFQVKYDWRNAADPALISYSAEELTILAETDYRRQSISLNFPGIGNGRLSREQVLPLIDILPENVTVWEL